MKKTSSTVTTQISWPEKYRPKILEDIVGQDDAINTVKGFIKKKQLPSTILISGGWGNGKTTLAELIPLMVNGNTKDTRSYNMADTRGIDAVREIIVSAAFLPRNKNGLVFIVLDECQMLTPQAASSLFKPLENGFKRVVFILVTSAPYSIPGPILSRASHIVLRPVPAKDLLPRLAYIAKKEHMKLGKNFDQVIKFIAISTGGQPRAAITLLQNIDARLAGSADIKSALQDAVKTWRREDPRYLAAKVLLNYYTISANAAIKVANAQNPPDMLQNLLQLNNIILAKKAGAAVTLDSLEQSLAKTEVKFSTLMMLHKGLVDALQLRMNGLLSDNQLVNYALCSGGLK